MSEDNPANDNEMGSGLCPECGGSLEVGFGLAGGGYGPYTYCLACERVVEKWQETDD